MLQEEEYSEEKKRFLWKMETLIPFLDTQGKRLRILAEIFQQGSRNCNVHVERKKLEEQITY